MRAAIGHALGWSIPDLMAMEWTDFVLEWGEARFIMEGPEKPDGE